jgi:uncharacterized membrane protein
MIDLILAVKFVHVLAAAAMFGGWLAIAAFMVLANRSGNTSVVALVAQFVVRVEMALMLPVMALQPLTGFPLAFVIGLSPFDEFWIVLSLAIFAAVVAAWIIAVVLEVRIREMARAAALAGTPLPAGYGRLFRAWFAVAFPIIAGMIALLLLMVWQPRLD